MNRHQNQGGWGGGGGTYPPNFKCQDSHINRDKRIGAGNIFVGLAQPHSNPYGTSLHYLHVGIHVHVQFTYPLYLISIVQLYIYLMVFTCRSDSS